MGYVVFGIKQHCYNILTGFIFAAAGVSKLHPSASG